MESPTTTLQENGVSNGQHNNTDVAQMATAAKTILASINGEDPDRDGLQGTPLRFAKAFSYFCEGYAMSAKEVVGDAIFEENHNEMVVVRDIPIYSLCEHHLVPFFGIAHIGYIPDPTVGIVGLSKLNRVADCFCRRLQTQERLTVQICQALEQLLRPRGVGVVLECRHLCMEMRGVKSACSTTRTTSMCGVFGEDPNVRLEFLTLALGGSVSTGISTNACGACHDGEEPAFLPPDPATLVDDSVRQSQQISEANMYRLYHRCARDEFSTIATAIGEAVLGPASEKNGGYSILDIGAGNGRLLQALCAQETKSPRVLRYAAFEKDQDLCRELHANVSKLGFATDNTVIHAGPFALDTSIAQAGGRADFVLLSHSLYGTPCKEAVVDQALKFVAPGGVLLIFHRWESGGTVDCLCNHLNAKSTLYHLRIWDTKLDLSFLTSDERRHLATYTMEEYAIDQDAATRPVACIAIEAYSSQYGDERRVAESIADSKKQVGYLARARAPALVVTPSSVVGIQACLRAASLKILGSEGVAIIGGGHSGNCLGDNAIVINMKLWDRVVVDSSRLLVRVGGGATIGAVTKECEKHGLVVPLGDRPGVGAGLILQGGLNHFMRRFGLATDNIARVRYVAPTGELLVAEQEKDLFAFRGAGSNFGVVLEIVMRASRLESVLAHDTEYLLSNNDGRDVLTSYSRAANLLPKSACIDGFLFWSPHDKYHDKLSFATSFFDTDAQKYQKSDRVTLPLSNVTDVLVGKPALHAPSELFDRELYMTSSFKPDRSIFPGALPPNKLRSLKRCLLLPLLTPLIESVLFESIREAPTKWCYVHLLHGGGAVNEVKPGTNAFGCRNWTFAAVITARWPDGNTELMTAADNWLGGTVGKVLPHAQGVYGSDLGPLDGNLARLAFGPNSLRLATMKRKIDPLNLLKHGCPLVGTDNDDDPRVRARGVVVVFCGRRCAGKDWLAQVAKRTLGDLVDNHDGDMVSIERISDSTKRDFAMENPCIDADRLIHDRDYKESHRSALCAFYEKKKAQDLAYDARCYVDCIENSSSSIVILTGMRDGLHYARSLAGRSVVLVKVNAADDAKRERGWQPSCEIDKSQGECSADSLEECFWDLVYENDSESTVATAEDWVKRTLAPSLLKACTRDLKDTPSPGVVYRDLVGSLLLQPFALRLYTALVVDWLRANGANGGGVDVVIAPEALGFVFASPIAYVLGKPLVLIRKQGKLPGDVHSVPYDGSNMQTLMDGSEYTRDKLGTSQSVFEIVAGSILPGQRILAVDDCLASGRTFEAMQRLVTSQGGAIRKFACVMELPDLLGRAKVPSDVDILSLILFAGQ